MTSSAAPLSADLAALAAEQYVSITTFRRTGVGVATPVWIARDGEALVFTTGLESGKVKRLRNNGDVELRPCTRTGEVADDAPRIEAHADVILDPEGVDAGIAAIVAKYGDQARRLMSLGESDERPKRAVIRITTR
ncbi:MAG: PPOX class F420-dependent oxidoreductase [Naasia sp.]